MADVTTQETVCEHTQVTGHLVGGRYEMRCASCGSLTWLGVPYYGVPPAGVADSRTDAERAAEPKTVTTVFPGTPPSDEARETRLRVARELDAACVIAVSGPPFDVAPCGDCALCEAAELLRGQYP